MTDQLGPSFDKRLRAELDRFKPPTPRPEMARFSLSPAGHRAWGRLKPALAVAAALAILMVVATAAFGSPNPGVWEQRAVTTVQSVTQTGPPSPTPEPQEAAPAAPATHAEPSETSEPGRESPEPSGTASPEPRESPEPTGSPEPTQPPEPTESPEPRDSPSPSSTDS